MRGATGRHSLFYIGDGSTVREPRYAFIKKLRGHIHLYRGNSSAVSEPPYTYIKEAVPLLE